MAKTSFSFGISDFSTFGIRFRVKFWFSPRQGSYFGFCVSTKNLFRLTTACKQTINSSVLLPLLVSPENFCNNHLHVHEKKAGVSMRIISAASGSLSYGETFYFWHIQHGGKNLYVSEQSLLLNCRPQSYATKLVSVISFSD